MSPRNAPATCCSTVGTFAFQAEPAQRGSPVANVPDHVGTPGYSVSVRVVGIRERENVRLGNRLQQSHAEDGGRDARRHHDIGMKRAEGEVVEMVFRFNEGVGFAVRV